ncbi:MAG TPA: dihydroorotate dehydrogenase electron transfer subunit [Candidatus Pygmaiobacter gallistercoris]|nr:dihydroorotate dehydrogenase electron transfer subunit [Candidatus Pygmaiobacter gallistercoris]
MQRQGIYTIQENAPLTRNVYRMVLAGDTGAIRAPGQFVNIRVEGCYLRRPISVADWDDNTLTLIYKVVGEGTKRLSRMGGPGAVLDLLVGLGNGYDLDCCGRAPVLIGGGVGVPPLYGLAKRLWQRGITPTVLLGFGSADEVFGEQEFRALGCPTMVATADGSYGSKGFVTDLLREAGMRYDYFYTCGPEPMLRAVYDACGCDGQLSFEERMGCGFGACMGCSCKTKYGAKRICKDGPVLKKEEVVW